MYSTTLNILIGPCSKVNLVCSTEVLSYLKFDKNLTNGSVMGRDGKSSVRDFLNSGANKGKLLPHCLLFPGFLLHGWLLLQHFSSGGRRAAASAEAPYSLPAASVRLVLHSLQDSKDPEQNNNDESF